MTTILDVLVPVALFVLLALPSLVGHARERAVDRQLRRPRRAGDARPQAGLQRPVLVPDLRPGPPAPCAPSR
ncbi:hypothetical protein ABZ506_33590 [Streptomyces lavendulocolor]|uniref:hypothetical protein n=1 Tax=Streptomyces lavendulocolor TaxID=67316 RepID=UPI0033C20F89